MFLATSSNTKCLLLVGMVACGPKPLVEVHRPARRRQICILGADFSWTRFSRTGLSYRQLVDSELDTWNIRVAAQLSESLAWPGEVDLQVSRQRNQRIEALSVSPEAVAQPELEEPQAASLKGEIAGYLDDTDRLCLLIVIEGIYGNAGIHAHFVLFNTRSGEIFDAASVSAKADRSGALHPYYKPLKRVSEAAAAGLRAR